MNLGRGSKFQKALFFVCFFVRSFRYVIERIVDIVVCRSFLLLNGFFFNLLTQLRNAPRRFKESLLNSSPLFSFRRTLEDFTAMKRHCHKKIWSIILRAFGKPLAGKWHDALTPLFEFVCIPSKNTIIQSS